MESVRSKRSKNGSAVMIRSDQITSLMSDCRAPQMTVTMQPTTHWV